MSNSIDRKNAVRDQIRKFITATETDRLNMLTFGFEVETQFSGDDSDECPSETWERIYNNLDRDDYEDCDSRYEDESEKLTELMKDGDISDLLGEISHYGGFTKEIQNTFKIKNQNYWNSPIQRILKKSLITYAEKLKARYERMSENELSDFEYCIKTIKTFSHWFKDGDQFKNFRSDDYSNDELPWFEGVRENADEYCAEGDYQLSLETVLHNHPDMRPDTATSQLEIETELLETVEDQSVSGVEIRTKGGLKFDETVKQGKIVFNEIGDTSDHYIDRDCSCHIHVQLNDDLAVNHYYGDGKLHAAIMEYLVFNLDRLPKSVFDRINHGHRHIEPTISGNGKFQWIHFHPQKTIEFRLFGNIDNADDLKQCLILTSEALAYGYQLRFADYDRSLTDTVLTECFNNLSCDCETSCLCFA